MAQSCILRAEAIEKAYDGKKIIKDAWLMAEPGKITGIWGSNASGRSLLCRILSGSEKKDKGRIYVGGKAVEDSRLEGILRKNVSYLDRNDSFFDDLSVLDNLVTLHKESSFKSIRQKQDYVAAEAILETAGVSVNPHYMGWQLSREERTRILLALSLYKGKRLLIIDNILQNDNEESLLLDLKEMLRKSEAGGLLISNNPDLMASVCDSIIFFQDGVTRSVFEKEQCDAKILYQCLIGKDHQREEEASLTDQEERSSAEFAHVLPPLRSCSDQALPGSLHARTGEIKGIVSLDDSWNKSFFDALSGKDVKKSMGIDPRDIMFCENVFSEEILVRG